MRIRYVSHRAIAPQVYPRHSCMFRCKKYFGTAVALVLGKTRVAISSLGIKLDSQTRNRLPSYRWLLFFGWQMLAKVAPARHFYVAHKLLNSLESLSKRRIALGEGLRKRLVNN
jgi:hypothetical protein